MHRKTNFLVNLYWDNKDSDSDSEWSCHTGPSNLQGSSSTSISSAWALCHEFESPCYFSIALQSLPSLPGLNHYTKRPVTSKTKSLSESKY